MVNFGVNGFGRIGRMVLRASLKNENVTVVGVNDPFITPDYAAYMFAHDSAQGVFEGEVSHDETGIIIDGKKVVLFTERDPANIKWGSVNAEVVLESTGIFKTKELASKHLGDTVRQVVISCPSPDTPTFVMNVNTEEFDTSMTVINNASCTTNCLAPVAKVLDREFGLTEGLMTTVHATTATQPTVDGPSAKAWRNGRSAMCNIIPASTGAAKAVTLVLPNLKGKLTGMAFRVPTVTGSVVDLTCKIEKGASYEDVCAAMKKASETDLKGVLKYTEDMIVSSDIIGTTYSSIFDASAGIQLNENFVKLISWYDNEYSYAVRCTELIAFVASKW